jgi:Rad3-related DNA helicase
VLPAFEHRPGQLEMARGVSEVLETGGILVAEAPTGIGKSLAYLIPAALHSLSQHLPVAVATQTLNLQDQLLDKDVPLVEATLDRLGVLAGEPLRVTVIKGRTNYLCRRRWDEVRRGGLELGPGTFERLAPWVIDSETGDLTEAEAAVGPLGADAAKLAADPATCSWARCRRGDDCFIRRLRRRAAHSHIVILNHALLFQHLLSDSGFLPDADGLVLDEAHQLERALTEACGREVSLKRIERLIGRALGGREASGSAAEVDELAAGEAEASGGGPGQLTGLGEAMEPRRLGDLGRIGDRLRAIPSDIDRLNLGRKLVEVGEILKRSAALTGEALRALGSRLDEVIRNEVPAGTVTQSPGAWRYTADGASELFGFEMSAARGALGEAVRGLRGLATAMDAVGPDVSLAPEDWLPEVTGLATDWGRLADDLEQLAAPNDADVYWIQAERRAASLHSLPLSVASAFAERILDRFRATILTSATLTVAGSFDHLANRLGLDRRDRTGLHYMDLDSPFEHSRQCILLADPGLVPPSAPGYAAAVARCLESLVVRVPRRTLVLFTSYALLRQVHARLAPVAAAVGRPLLAQGIHGPRQIIAQRHRNDPGSILLGTASFWEGVDFPGEELEVLVITRLPFPVPGEPLVAARAEKLLDEGVQPFTHLFLPEAVLRFRQGFGRLIRSLDDRGAVICLDPRLLTASYGELFVRSLPIRPRIALGDSLVESVVTWFAGGELPEVAEAPRRHRGTRRSPRAAAAETYAVDELEFDPDDPASLERESVWQSRTFTREDGSIITIERLEPAEITEARDGDESASRPEGLG